VHTGAFGDLDDRKAVDAVREQLGHRGGEDGFADARTAPAWSACDAAVLRTRLTHLFIIADFSAIMKR